MESRVFEMLSKSRTIFKFSKNAQNFSQMCPNVFWTCFGIIFPNFFLPSFPWRVESSRCFRKVEQFSNFPKMPKIVRKSVQKCFEHVLGYIFLEKFFCPVFHGGLRLRNVFRKSKNFQNCKNAQNRSQKFSNVFWTCFGVIFLKKFFCPVFHGESSLRNAFEKI